MLDCASDSPFYPQELEREDRICTIVVDVKVLQWMVTLDTVNILRTRKITADCCVLLIATHKDRSVYAQAKDA